MADPVFNPNAPYTSIKAAPKGGEPVFDPTQPFLAEGGAGSANDPLAAASGGQPTYIDPRQAEPESRYGIDPAAKEFISGGHTFTPLGLAANALDYGVMPFQAVGHGVEALSGGLDTLAKNTGLADLPQTLGLDKLTGVREQLLPGTAIMSAMEAFPLGSAEIGGIHGLPSVGEVRPLTKAFNEGSKPARLAPELEAGLENLYKIGSADDIINFAKQNNIDIDTQGILNYVHARDAGKPVDPTVTYNQPQPFKEPVQQELPMDQNPRQQAFDFNQPTLEQRLQQEAQDFRMKKQPESTVEQVFARPEEQGNLFDNRNAQGELFDNESMPHQTKPQEAAAPAEKPTFSPADEAHRASLEEAWHENTKDWANRPDVEVVHSAKDIADDAARGDALANPDAPAFIGADGKVRIIAKNIASSSEIPAIAFHEALGHHGLSQIFGDTLDSTLTGMYDSTPWFRNKVNKWMEDNPGSYADSPSRVARAADEVLAEMSEGGPIERGMFRRGYDQLANAVKDFGRKMGLKSEYSPREINSILGKAHDAITKGTDVESNGFTGGPRFKMAPEDRRSAIKKASAELNTAKPGETKTTRPFPEDEPDYHRFLHVTPEGKKVSGTYTLENGTLDNFSINTEGGPRAIGPKGIRQIGRDLMKEHPEAKNITGYRISGARPNEEVVQSGSRFYPAKKKSLSPDTIKTVGDLDDVMDFVGKEADRKGLNENRVVPIAESLRDARDLGLNASKLLRTQGLNEKQLSARIAGAKQVLTDQVQDMLRLKDKIESEGMTPSNLTDLQQRIATTAAVYARFNNDTAELGRAMRLLRETTESRKLGKEVNRFMESKGLEGVLSDPESVTRFLDSIKKANDEGGINEAAKATKELDKSSAFLDTLGLPRALMSSADLSAPFRQGIFLVSRGAFWKGIPKMMQALASEKVAAQVRDDIMNRPTYPLMEKARLAVNEGISGREESFVSKYATKIPWVRGSERAYNTFLHKLRADVFDDIHNSYQKAGVEVTPDLAKGMANYINKATGRGQLHSSLEGAAPALNAMFFSPRLMSSRLSLLRQYVDPRVLKNMDPVLRKQVARDMIGFAGVSAGVLGLAQLLGAKVEKDPRSSDFGKIRTGNTSYDLGGGFNQYLTLASRLAPLAVGQRGTYKTNNGDVKQYSNKFGEKNEFDAASDFLTSKTSPIASYIIQYMKGSTPSGEKFSPGTEAVKRIVPMIAQDMYDAYNDSGVPGALEAGVASGIGAGVQTYPRPNPRKYDAYGEEADHSPFVGTRPEAKTPGVQEVQRLEDATGTDVGTYVGKQLTINGEPKLLNEDEYNQYQQMSGKYFSQIMDQVVNSPDYKAKSDQDKLKDVQSIRNEVRREVADYLFRGNND